MAKDNQNAEHHSPKPKGNRSGFRLTLPSWMKKNATRKELEAEIERQIRSQDSNIPNEILKQIVQDISTEIQKDEAKNSISSRLIRFVLPLTILGVIFSLIFALIFNQSFEQKFEKYPIQQDILRAIRNGADVETLKVIFKTRSIPVDSLAVLIRSYDFYSKTNTTLMDVLNDLKTNILIQKDNVSDQDKVLVERIDSILMEYSKVNPFDGLEEDQRRDLMNIAKKLPPESYSSISDDVTSLVIELKQKNNLVSKYLNSSELSLWVSIIALALTVGLGFWQFRPRARKTQKDLIQEALAEFNVNRGNDMS